MPPSKAAPVTASGGHCAWLQVVEGNFKTKLAIFGLIDAPAAAITLAELIDLYGQEREADNKACTQVNFRRVAVDLTGFCEIEAGLRGSLRASTAGNGIRRIRPGV